MEDAFAREPELLIPIIAIVGGLSVAVIGIVFTSWKSVAVSKAQEQSRREIAAYVAEGSISAEEGERLIRADSKSARA